jgi:Flp pilus assembly pilin Flp
MLKLYLQIRNWLVRDEGQDLAEYALLIGLIALAVIGAVTFLGTGIDTTFRNISDTVQGWAVPAVP